MLTRKHRLLSLLLMVILVCSQFPSAAVQAPEAPPPLPDTVPAPFSDRLQAEALSGALPRGIAPEVPLNAEGWLDLPGTLADSAPLRQPEHLESCFGYQQLKDPTLQIIYQAMYTAITEAEDGRAMPFNFSFDTPTRFGWDEMQRVQKYCAIMQKQQVECEISVYFNNKQMYVSHGKMAKKVPGIRPGHRSGKIRCFWSTR